MLPLRPDMASLSVGSNNFPTRVYENPPDLVDWLAAEMLTYDVKPEIEAFDLSHIFQAARDGGGRAAQGAALRAVRDGREERHAGGRAASTSTSQTLKRLAPDAQWCAAGIGPKQIVLNEWASPRAGIRRTGLEDNVRLDKRPARAVERRAGAAGRGAVREARAPRGDYAQAREMLGLRAA